MVPSLNSQYYHDEYYLAHKHARPQQDYEECVSPRSPPRQKRRQSRSRAVTFAAYEEVVEIPHINDLSMQEIQDVWFSRAQLQYIKERCKGLVFLLEKGEFKMDQLQWVRGLDQRTTIYLKKRNSIQEVMYKCVLGIQSIEKKKFGNTSEATSVKVAQLCAKYSSTFVAAARERGLSDAIEVSY